MSDIIQRKETLPGKTTDLKMFILIGEAKLKSYRAKLKAIQKLGVAKDMRESALDDAQEMGNAVLRAEAKLGDILSKETLKGRDVPGKASSGVSLKDLGLTQQESYRAQLINQNKDLIHEVIKEARKSGDIPTKRAMMSAIAAKKKAEKELEVGVIENEPEEIEIGAQGFSVIYADPPWHETGISLDDLMAYQIFDDNAVDYLFIKDIIAKDAVLFLWAPPDKLADGIKVLEMWGFRYTTNLIWDFDIHKKTSPYSLERHEHLLIGIAGTPKIDTANSNDSIIITEEWSDKKPVFFRSIIESMFTTGRKLELFGKKNVEGWNSVAGKE